MILLIDGDQFLYRAAAAAETEVRWDEDNHLLYSNFEEAWETAAGSINNLLAAFRTKEHAVVVGQGKCFRYKIDPQYKANRKSTRKPLCLSRMYEKLREEYRVVSFEGLEADDVLGVLATKPGPTQRIIVAQDKDMKTLPATVYNGKELVTYTVDEADTEHLRQTLVGDRADGFPGCPGVGAVGAVKLLKDCKTLEDKWAATVNAFVKAGQTVEDALRNARLARILRWTDWDSEKKEPILWQPPELKV